MTTPNYLYSDCAGWVHPVTSGGASGIGPVNSGDYGIVVFAQNPSGTMTLIEPPTVTWGVTPLTNLGGVYLNNSQGSGMVIIYGGYVSAGTANFVCASGTAFCGGTWGGLFSGVNTVSALQTKAGDQDTPPGGSQSLGGLLWTVVAASVPFEAGGELATEIGTADGISYAIGVGPREPNVTAEWGTPVLYEAGVWGIGLLNLN